jgi:hypothetical protein
MVFTDVTVMCNNNLAAPQREGDKTSIQALNKPATPIFKFERLAGRFVTKLIG